jgi:hypothetical protein
VVIILSSAHVHISPPTIYLAASITAAAIPALITAVTGIPISVKVFQNFDLRSYFAYAAAPPHGGA